MSVESTASGITHLCRENELMLLENLVTRRVSEENTSNSSLKRRFTKQRHLFLAALVTNAPNASACGRICLSGQGRTQRMRREKPSSALKGRVSWRESDATQLDGPLPSWHELESVELNSRVAHVSQWVMEP